MNPADEDLASHRAAIIKTDRCHYIIDKGDRVLIPGCMGAAVYGEGGCTCEDAPGGNAELRALVERLHEHLMTTRLRCGEMEKQMRAMNDRLRHLETFLKPKA